MTRLPRLCRSADLLILLFTPLLTCHLGAVAAVGEATPPVPDFFATDTPDGWQFDQPQVVAYEDHELFLYVVAKVSPAAGADQRESQLLRRVCLLRPDALVIEDLIKAPARRDRRTRVTSIAQGDSARSSHRTHSVTSAAKQEDRAKEILAIRATSGQRTFLLHLPPADQDAGTIEVRDSDGTVLLPERLLPAGVLPFGPEGRQLLLRWDRAYRPGGRAPWDVGRPSEELKRVVQEKIVPPGRAIVLGCGTGTNAIYLAQQGFAVTGVDIAPSALNKAREKAKNAGVSVRWLLADVTAPPDLPPFDFVFDRGCYHGVRRQNSEGYVSALRQLTHADSRILILAGHPRNTGSGGPPRVQEKDIRDDFREGFTLEWLKESRFESRDPNQPGALAWSIFLRRTGQP